MGIVILLFQLGYHISNFMVRTVETLPVSMVKEEQCISSDGYIVRNEIPLSQATDGILSPSVPDGTRVSVGNVVAEAYDSGAAQSQHLRELSVAIHQKSLLEQAISQKGSYSGTSAEREIARLLSEINKLTADGKTAGISTLSDSLQVMLYIRQLKAGKDLSKIKQSLEEKIDGLKAQVGGAITTVESTESGYYFSNCDGYESQLSINDLESVSSSELRALLSRKVQPQISPTSAGKIVTDYKWGIVMEIPFQDAQSFVQGKQYQVKMEELGDTHISVKLQRTIVELGSDTVILIFVCTDMPLGFSYTRYQSVSVVIGETEGFRLPITAIRQLNGITGVYILKGRVVEFREVSPVLMVDGAVLVSSSAEPTGKYSMLNRYDTVIVRGKELQIGKIISE